MPKRAIQGPCRLVGCGTPMAAKGMCAKHYNRQRLYGRTDKKNLGDKRSHPLYMIWFERKQRGSLCPEWASDIYAFAAAVGERPSPTHLLRQLRGGEPYGPGNWEWMDALKRQPGEGVKDFNARKWASRRERFPQYESDRSLRRKYNLTRPQYDQMEADQGGVCAICHEPEKLVHRTTGAIRALAVDHCHETGMNRALLCWRCNTTFGKLMESVSLMEGFITYAQKWHALK